MRVAVTGLAIWCSLGRTLSEFEAGLREGRSGRRAVTRFDVSHRVYRTRGAAVLADEDAIPAEVDETRLADLALVVAREALVDAGLPGGFGGARHGVALGTSHGGNIALMKFVRGRLGLAGGRLDPRLLLETTPTVVGQVARHLGLRGPTVTISTACASGTNSIGRALELIKAGRADLMVAGGVDMFTEHSFSGFNILAALAREACRPLDRDRDGMTMGDGAAFVVLESEAHARARGARVYVEAAGHAIANDAYHPTAPMPDGRAAARVMEGALLAAGVGKDEVDYINLHGTGTPANDLSELRAIERLFGPRARSIPISSTKSMTGHALGAAGSVEFVAAALGMARGFLPPTINLRTPIEGFEDWNYVRDRALPAEPRAALSNSFGFSGNLASIVARRWTP